MNTPPTPGPFLRDPVSFLHHLAHQPSSLVAETSAVCAAIILLSAIYRLGRHRIRQSRHARFTHGARQITVQPPPNVEPDSARQFWSNLTGLLRPTYKRLLSGQPHLAFEYIWDSHAMTIRLWVPGQIPPGLIERAVEAAWPGARTVTANPPTSPLPPNAMAVGGRLRLARPDYFPLQTDHDSDPLRTVVGAASGLAVRQHACVQILARPVTGRRLARAHQIAAALRSGRATLWRGRLFDLITPVRPPRPTSSYVQHPERPADIRAILDKATEPRWDVVIRYAVADDTATDRPEQARSLQRALRGRAHALASAYAVFTGRNRLRRHRVRDIQAALDRRWLDRGDLLSVTELSAIAHLPLDPAVPGVQRAGARAVPPPPAVQAPSKDLKLLGTTDAGAVRPVGISVADARHHLHILGATGSGKSTLIGHLVLADVRAGRGTVVIDPKGDLVTDLLSRLPEEAASTTVVLDPADRAGQPPMLNVLAGPDRNLTADNLVGIFRRIYSDSWGPRTDDILRSTCLTLWQERGSLADIPRVLTDAAYRAKVTARLRDPVLRSFWRWYDALSEGARAHATGPLLNKLRAFLLRDFIRSTIGSGDTTIDLTSVLNGGLLLVRAAKGILGADCSALLGSLIVAKVWETASHRTRLAPSARRDCSLYIDECHNFLNLPHSLADLLAEARAYRLSVVLAHQNLTQLDRELREAVSANARSKIYFATSPEDAHDIQRHVLPTLTEHDLAHLDSFQAAARLIANGAETPAFTLRTKPLPKPIPGQASKFRQAPTSNANPSTAQSQPLEGDPRLT